MDVKNKMKIFIVLLCLVSALFAVSISQEDNQKLWSSYQYALYEKLRDLQCRSVGCPSHQSFQVIDNAQEVNFGDQAQVNNLCKFVPKWSSAFEPQCSSESCAYTDIVKRAITAIPNVARGGQLFLSYSRTADKKWNAEYAGSMTTMLGLNSAERAHTVVSVKMLRYISQQYTGNNFFWRVNGNGQLSSVPLSTTTFEMEMSAKNIHVYKVTPLSTWFDKSALTNEFYNDLKPDFFGPHKPLHLIPNTFFVAEAPRVVTRISQVTYDSLVNSIKTSSLDLVKIGGLQFRGDAVQQLSDDEFHLVDRSAGTVDKIRFRKLNFSELTEEEVEADFFGINLNMAMIRCGDANYARLNPNLCNTQPAISATGRYELVMESGTSQLIGVMLDVPDRTAVPIVPNAIATNIPRSFLENAAMHPGQFLLSDNTFFKFTLNPEGFVNIVDVRYGQEIWRSNGPQPEHDRPHTLVMQGDGNLVLYTKSNKAVWNTRTNGKGAAPHRLVMQDDRNLVIYANGGQATWSSQSTAQVDNPVMKMRAVLGHGETLYSGEFLIASDANAWATLEPQCVLALRDKRKSNGVMYRTYPTILPNPADAPCRLVMQTDGNLVIYNKNNGAVWNSRTANKYPGPYRLDMQTDGNLVIYGANNHPLWSSFQNTY